MPSQTMGSRRPVYRSTTDQTIARSRRRGHCDRWRFEALSAEMNPGTDESVFIHGAGPASGDCVDHLEGHETATSTAATASRSSSIRLSAGPAASASDVGSRLVVLGLRQDLGHRSVEHRPLRREVVTYRRPPTTTPSVPLHVGDRRTRQALACKAAECSCQQACARISVIDKGTPRRDARSETAGTSPYGSGRADC